MSHGLAILDSSGELRVRVRLAARSYRRRCLLDARNDDPRLRPVLRRMAGMYKAVETQAPTADRHRLRLMEKWLRRADR